NLLLIRKSVGDEVTSITENQMNIQDLYLTINEESDFMIHGYCRWINEKDKSLFAECALLYSPTDEPEQVITTTIIEGVGAGIFL
ncbi:unnamed protein product, partial [Rotaria magnacalcarata]